MANNNSKSAQVARTPQASLMEKVMEEFFGKQMNPDKDRITTEVEFSKDTKKVIIPEGMTKLEAAQDLQNQWNNEEQVQNFTTAFEGWDWKDALRAIRNVIEEDFGWIKGKSTFFSTPTEIDIVTDIKDGKPIMEKAFYGKMTFPAYEEAGGSVGIDDYGIVHITLNAKRKFGGEITKFFQRVNSYLLTNSIYRGKAVVVTQKVVDGNKIINLEINEIKENKNIVLNPDADLSIQNFVIDALGDRGKASYLFTGSYGNGKTETALRVGVEAMKRGMSFFYVKDSALFEQVLAFAKNYEPCVIFLEDVDEIAAGTDRTERMNKILNTLDGVQTKGRDMKVIFTTNHEKRINPALRRPGRIDLIVDFKNPEPETQQAILEKLFANIKGHSDIDYAIVVPKLPDAQGAVIAAIGLRARKLAERKGFITTDHVLASIASMEHQVKFMAEDVSGKDELAKAFDLVREYQLGDRNFPQPTSK